MVEPQNKKKEKKMSLYQTDRKVFLMQCYLAKNMFYDQAFQWVL